MADIEAKLNMSLDDLAKKDKVKEPQQQRGWHGPDRSHQQSKGTAQFSRGGRSGPQQQRGQYQGFRHNSQAAAALQFVQQEQWAQPPQQQQWGGLMPQMQQPWGPMQHQQQQQQWGGAGGRGAGGGPRGSAQYDPSHRSVFARLSGAAPGPGGPRGQQPQQPPPQQQPAAPPRKAPRVQCRVDTDSGDVVITYNNADIVRVGKTGDVVLDSCGRAAQDTLDAFNCVLSHLGMSVKAAAGQDAASGAWSVSDGKRLLRFADGMRVPSRGPLTAGRAMVLMQAYATGPSKAAAAAAEEASKQAAIAAGLLPADADAAGADGVSSEEAARLRRLKAQGRFQPY